MEGPSESFIKFKTFLNALFIRRKKEGFNDNDFKKDQFEYIQPYLEELLPLISIEEAQRIKIYFNNAYTFHLNNGLRIANIFPRRSLSPETVIAQEYEVEQSSGQEKYDEVEQLSQQERLETQVEMGIDDSELSSRQFAPQQSGPLMQSTPLSVPLLPGEPRILNALPQEEGPNQDIFVADILSQLNISPISILSAPLPNVQPTNMSTPNVERNAISFLRNFVNIERETLIHEQPIAQNTPRRTRKRQNIQLISREAKKMMDKVKFDSICLLHKTKTDKQIKRSEESFLYFFLIRGKQNIISRSNTIIPEGQRGHISLQRVNNLSNILRAHASQGQTSVEQPVQISQINSTHSPLTPQGLLQTSLPFTPLRGDISGIEPRTVLDQASSFPTRSLLRQQPLLPIPERESSIHIPDTPQVEEVCINEPPTFSNLPREDPENFEIIEGQLLQIAYNDPSQDETQQKQVSLNSSSMNIQPLIEHEPILPLRSVVEDQPSIVPGMISGDFEIIEQSQLPVDALTSAQQSLFINQDIETRSGLAATSKIPTPLPGFFQEQPLLTPTLPMQLQHTIAQDDPSLIDDQSDNFHFNWFEILRPRGDLIEYPRDVPRSRRNRRRRRRRDSADRDVRNYDLPVIPRSPSHANINESVAPQQMPQNHEPLSTDDLNPLQQDEVANEIIPDPNNLINDLAENLLSPPARCSEGPNGFSDQITQYPIQIETQLKEYLELIKRAGRKLEYVNWERFDSVLFNENDRFELYTNIFKRIIKDNYVAMDRLYEHGTTRLEAAKGFKFILDLKTMGLIEIESVETRILGIRLITAYNAHKL